MKLQIFTNNKQKMISENSKQLWKPISPVVGAIKESNLCLLCHCFAAGGCRLATLERNEVNYEENHLLKCSIATAISIATAVTITRILWSDCLSSNTFNNQLLSSFSFIVRLTDVLAMLLSIISLFHYNNN